MDDLLLRVFQAQVRLQCQAVITAALHFNDARAAADTEDREKIAAATWIAIQNILGGAANASKALWGQGGKYAEQRAFLRASLQVSDDSALRDVAMRNNFEHLDERLDRWWKESEGRNYLDLAVADLRSIVGLDPRDMFRVLDPNSLEVVFWGERFSLPAIIDEAGRISLIAQAELAKPPMP